MSGPIVRRYGFPNFDQIFGKRELEHGVDDEAANAAESSAETEPEAEPEAEPETKPKAKSRKKSK